MRTVSDRGSHSASGFDELERVRKKYGTAPWFSAIRGEFSGDLLRTPLPDLRRIGRARYDNVELIWDYDAMPPLRALKVPQLWVLAGADREAPPEIPRERLGQLKREGKPIGVYVFPDTDHGIVEFETMPDGSRRVTRYADGFFRLLGDWIKGEAKGPYGRAAALD